VSIPAATVGRLVTYLRVLADLIDERVEKTSSEELARLAHVTAFQVRKDLAYCGRLGTRGSGYQVGPLEREVRRVLGLTRVWGVGIMGMGRLGQALADYPSFGDHGLALRTAYDADPAKVGLEAGRLRVEGLDALPESVRREDVEIAILAVPAAAAQDAADALVAAGVRGILNFAPAAIDVPATVSVESVDFHAALKRLIYRVSSGEADAGDG
jgi:redox-sensing transcriptional repressor